MKEYHKIHTLYERDPATNHKTLIEGRFARPEFEYLADRPWVFTEKVDGTNIRVQYSSPDADGHVRFGGRTDDAQIPAFLVEHLMRTFTMSKMEAAFPDSLFVTLYGEGYGPKIQKGGGRYREDAGFILFDVTVGDMDNDVWLERHNVEDVAAKLGIPVVPVVGEGTVYDAVALVKEGFQSRCATDQTLIAEGIVFRPKVELFDRRGQRIISKLKVKDFIVPQPRAPRAAAVPGAAES
jgi:hypothetical protein